MQAVDKCIVRLTLRGFREPDRVKLLVAIALEIPEVIGYRVRGNAGSVRGGPALGRR